MQSSATVSALRRYPVKSMAGESLARAAFDGRGMVGDRWYAVRDGDGRLASGKSSRRFRRHDAVFGFRAETRAGGVVVSDASGCWSVHDPRLDERLSAVMATPVSVVEEGQVRHFDAGAVSMVGTATLAWCAQRWGIDADPRRLRVNLLVDTAEPFQEEAWVGGAVAVGSAHLLVVRRTERCRMIDVAQDGATADGLWLRALARERQLCLAVYAAVARPGVVSVGDRVQLLEPDGA